MNMRPPSIVEKNIIERMAAKLSEPLRSTLLSDLKMAVVADSLPGETKISFAIRNYDRPKYRGQHPYNVEGRIMDEDGAEISVILYADENDHLLELEFIRWSEGAIRAPKLDTLRLY